MDKVDKCLTSIYSSSFLKLLVIGLAWLLLPIPFTYADIAPFYTMDFIFEYSINSVPIIEGQLLECSDAVCSHGQPRPDLSYERFGCTTNECQAHAYNDPPYYKIIIQFSDKTRESNVFTSQQQRATFIVSVSESNLEVQEVISKDDGLNWFSFALLSTLVLEILVAGIYLYVFRLPTRVLLWIPLANILTVPVVWFVFSKFVLSSGWIIILSEIFAVLFEIGFIYRATNKNISLKHVAALTILMNGVSFWFGLFLWRLTLIPW